MQALNCMFSFLTVFLMMYRVRGAILIGIFLTSIISWPRGTPFTAFPHTDTGNAAFDFFKKVVTFHPIKLIGNAIDYHYSNGRVWYALITMLYVDILDSTGTLYSMAKFAGLRDPVTMDFERSTVAYCVDAFSISMGALMGTSPVTAFVESATGISGALPSPYSGLYHHHSKGDLTGSQKVERLESRR
jgi:adenine/guanine/hypoxanthine permease